MLASSIALGLAAALFAGGDLSRVRKLRFAGVGLLFAAAAIRLTGAVVPLSWVVYLASLLCVLAAAAMNRHLPGVPFIAAGVASNALVIALNGGMPVDMVAATTADAVFRDDGLHVEMTAETHLNLLGDLVPVRALRNVYSFGDFMLAAGGFWLPFSWLRR